MFCFRHVPLSQISSLLAWKITINLPQENKNYQQELHMKWKTEITVLFLIGFLTIFCGGGISDSHQGLEQKNHDHPAAKVIDGFHLMSYYAGSVSTATEFVSYGCKKLALSATLSDEELALLLPHAENKADEYGIPFYVEKDLLVTPLFSATIAEGKTVILFAYNKEMLDEYFAIKASREKAIAEDRLKDVEVELGWRFGRLLSYTDETIERLLGEEK
jgi:hypothetical protein